MKYIAVLWVVLMNSFGVFGQCDTAQEIHNYLKSNLEYDTCSLYQIPITALKVDFTYFDEEISIDFKRFKMLKDVKVDFKHKLDFESLSDPLEGSKYVVFHSSVHGQYIMVETLYNRPSYLNNAKEETEFKRRRRFNGGVSYVFIIDKKGCIQEVKKTISQYG